MTDTQLYSSAFEFLLMQQNVTREMLDKHLVPECDKPNDLNAVFRQVCETAQNRQMSSKVVGGSINGIQTLSGILCGFDPHLVALKYLDIESRRLLSEIVEVLNPSGQIRQTSRSLWPQFCKSVIDGANFLSKFSNSQEFYTWIGKFSIDPEYKLLVPIFISNEISGFGIPLACDLLKELGFTEFGKPDVHLRKLFESVHFIPDHDFSGLKADIKILQVIDRIAIANNTTPYAVDKLFWLIGSGNFYLSQQKIGRKRKAFLEFLKKK